MQHTVENLAQVLALYRLHPAFPISNLMKSPLAPFPVQYLPLSVLECMEESLSVNYGI